MNIIENHKATCNMECVQNVIIIHIVTIQQFHHMFHLLMLSLLLCSMKNSLISITTLTPNFASTPREKLLIKVKML